MTTKRRDYIMVLAAAAAAKNPKKKKNNSSGNNSNSNSTGATTAPQDVYEELERGFDTAYVVSEDYEAMDRIVIDPLADNGERTNVVPQFHDWYFYIWLDILTNEMYLAYKREKKAQFEHISLESEKFKEFAKNHDKLVNKYVRPLEYLVYEGISVYETRKVQRDREQGIEL